MMLKIEVERRLRAANDAVLRFMREHRVATLWGRGLFASADMMSLEATRYLWSARIDPRRRTFAVGTYAHVLDQWGIFYDQPIVLNRRQAGAAIEGALRQRQVERIERVAVDTHGFTHFAMALAKLVGFDLCPRLAGLKTRRLYLPRGLEVPHVLRPIVAETVSRRAVGRGWEGLLRLGASVKHGWDSATAALDRFGSAAAGDPVYNAGDALGRLLRSLYLCDYLSNPMFRTEVLDLLNQGEAVHSLQRAIHNGMITAKQGRTTEELGTISGALTLLANIVMAWNTHHLQIMLDRAPGDHPDEVVSRLAPIGHKHINMRGILTFDLARYRSSLLRQPLSRCRRPGVELKKLTLSRYQRVAAPTARQAFEITCFSDRHFWHEDDDKADTQPKDPIVVTDALPISRFPVPDLANMPEDIRNRILAVQEKSGFIPNVFLVLAHRPDEFRAFFAYHDALMEKPGNLTKAEREMIVVATSSSNQCQYCVVAHGAMLRIRAKNPLISDQVAINYRKADITERQKAMLDFVLKVSRSAETVGEADFDVLKSQGFGEEDIWDIAAIAAFFGLSNRMANVTAMRPNAEFYTIGRS